MIVNNIRQSGTVFYIIFDLLFEMKLYTHMSNKHVIKNSTVSAFHVYLSSSNFHMTTLNYSVVSGQTILKKKLAFILLYQRYQGSFN